MNKIKLLIWSVTTSLLISGCSAILEPVALNGKLGSDTQSKQEDFSPNIKPLTYSSAKDANKYPYVRQIMRTGSGLQANVFNESDFINAKLPNSSKKPTYLIGVGDQLSFKLKSEFLNDTPQLPDYLPPSEYVLGVGDELVFIQQNELKNIAQSGDEGLTVLLNYENNNKSLKTSGIVGTNGNILLLGLGNIGVVNRSLADIRAEVRNILIRDGLAPNFQLEITKFKSKKAYLTVSEGYGVSSVININSLPKTLEEIVLGAGVSKSSGNSVVIILERGSKEYRITAEQLFDTTAHNVYIQDNDTIDIRIVDNETVLSNSTVDTQGTILLPIIGTVKAEGHSLSEIQVKITKKLLSRGLMPTFQLEITKFNSKFAYLVQNGKSIAVPLTNNSITIRELILSNSSINIPINKPNGSFVLFTLKREGKEYNMTGDLILNPKTKNIWLQDGDHIEIETLEYKPGQVFALSGSNSAVILPINPSIRETLADVLFVPNGALSNSFVRRSEVYLLRGQSNPMAYHLDAQNVSRLLVAAKTELRPNDIIFVAERPIISFARTLAEITPLRTLLNDIRNRNIP
jgi:protein involved in polysaccharide export with SLBB domain